MKTYKDIYSFNVIDEIKKGHQVFVVDHLRALVHSANSMDAESLIAKISSEEKNRYAFWKVEEEDLDAENI